MYSTIPIIVFLVLGLNLTGFVEAHAVYEHQIGAKNIHISLPEKEKSDYITTQSRQAKGVNNEAQGLSNFAYFNRMPASSDLKKLIHWIIETGDNHNFPYLIIDKANAQLLVFRSNGQLAGTAPILLGMARGDELRPGSNMLQLSEIGPAERITPAGRFTLEFGHNLQGQDIFWIEYEAAISLHRLFEGNAKEHRKERLETPTALDNRISYGCINVSKAFYEKTIRTIFRHTTGLAYIMPEEKPIELPFK